jgi:hypothetical protein
LFSDSSEAQEGFVSATWRDAGLVAGAVAIAAGLMLLGVWIWQAIHPMLAVGPIAAAQLVMMLGLLDRGFPRVVAGLVWTLKLVAGAALGLGATYGVLWAVAVLAGYGPPGTM